MHGWSAMFDFMSAGLLIWLVNWLALIPWRQAQDAHWTERARRLHPVRATARGNLLVVPVIVMLVHRLVGLERAPAWWLSLLAAWLGALLGTYPLDREVCPWLRFGSWFREALVSRVLLLAHILLWAGLFLLMPSELSGEAWLVLLLAVAIQAGYAWGGLLHCLRLLRLIRPAPRQVQELVAELADRMGITAPPVWILRSAGVNAFALPHSRSLVLTERCLAVVPEDELAAIGAHEMGHLRESSWARWFRFASTLLFLPWLMVKPLYCSAAWIGVAGALLAPFVLLQVVLVLSRRLERRADQIALHNQRTEGVYARALARIYEESQVPAVLPGKHHLHPNLYDRLQAAGLTPDYPRPKPPAALAWPSIVLCALLGILVGWHPDTHSFVNTRLNPAPPVAVQATESSGKRLAEEHSSDLTREAGGQNFHP